MSISKVDRDIASNPLGTIEFVALAGLIASDARSLQLRVPGFSTPPSRPACMRTIRRLSDGESVVSVAIRGRTVEAVKGDLVEGIIASNELPEERAAAVRRVLLEAA